MYSVVTVFWKITQWGNKTDMSICKVPYFARLGAISQMHYVCLFGVSPTKYFGVLGSALSSLTLSSMWYT